MVLETSVYDKERPTVLVVDYAPDLRYMAREILEKRGYRVLTAQDGYEAIQVVSGEREVDLLFLDVMMPGMDGLQVLEEMERYGFLATFVVILTDKSDPQTIQRALQSGAHYYLIKPVRRRTFLNVVEYLIGESVSQGRKDLDEIVKEDLRPVSCSV